MSDFKAVELVSPDGRSYTATTALEFNNLVYGHGYKQAETKPPAKADTKKPDTTG